MLYLEDFFRTPLNVFGDLMAMRGASQEGAEDEHIKGALQESHAG
jgi:hypothetical protein